MDINDKETKRAINNYKQMRYEGEMQVLEKVSPVWKQKEFEQAKKKQIQGQIRKLRRKEKAA